MAALGRLSAAIAHEIRQPLTAMTGALKELARFAPLEDDDKKLVQIVSRESQRLNQIITEFLDYSREKSYAFADVDMLNVIEETLVLIERNAAASGKIRIERHFSQRPLRARADRDAMKQVLWNLCNNALRAMPDGGVLSVRAEAVQNSVRISIRDTGRGMEPGASARIFEPFQSAFPGGTGLGLAIVYQILQAHRGRIHVETGLGSGAEFIVDLPSAANAVTRRTHAQHRAASGGKTVNTDMAHLLIVDDEPSIRELLEISFRKEGHKVEVAASGEAAKRQMASRMFDIVVSDICLPDMDGVELLRYCKEVSPATVFILITGVPTIGTAIDAVNFGADRYVIKGDRLLDELRPAVQRVAESPGATQGSRLLAPRTQAPHGTGSYDRHQPQNAVDFRADSEYCAAVQPRPDHRRKWNGKGTRSTRHTREQRARQRARSSPSIAAPFRKPCSNPNCSVM